MTKIDMCPANVYKQNIIELRQHLVDAQRKGFLIGPKTQDEQIRNLAEQIQQG